jgi:hypothetical protein
MKKLFSFFILIFILISEISNDYFSTDFLDSIDKTAYNINTATIQYSLTYKKSILKVSIKTEDKIKQKINFVAFLRSENNNKEYKLKCLYPHEDIIECKPKSGLILDVNDKYHIYYNRSNKEKLIFDYEDIMEDDKRISLIFKPDLYVNQTVYLDNKKIMAQINRKCVAGGYLYIINKRKKVQNLPNDGFNKFIELNNFIYEPDYDNVNLMDIYKLAIRKGYHIIETEIVLNKEDVIALYRGNKNINYEKNIIKFSELLKLSKENEIILDIKFNYLNIEKNKIKSFLNKIIEEIEQYGMINSIIFNDLINLDIISKLKNIRTNIPISISTITKKEDIEKIKSYLDEFNRVILSIDSNIDEFTLNYIKSLNYKIKYSHMNSRESYDKLTSNGVNYIGTDTLEPFLINNDKDYSMSVECVPIFLDDLSECKMSNEHILRDNEFYNIHYSSNIYKKSMDINETAIGEFRYEDTKINDMKYYVVKNINIEKGIINLITSDKIAIGKKIKGKIGPNFDNVADIYIFDFICEGIGQNYINCKIEKDDNKIEFNGNYAIYNLENYSFNEEEIEDFNLMKLKYRHIYSNQEKAIYYSILIFITFCIIYYSYPYMNEKYY